MATDNLGQMYLDTRRSDEAMRAGDEALSAMGLDAKGYPIQKPGEGGAAPAAPAGAPLNRASATIIDMRAASLQRMAKLRKDIAQPPEKQPSFWSDVVGGTFSEIGRGIAGGAATGVKEMLESADSLAGFINEKLGTKKGGAFKSLAEMVPEVSKQQTPGGEVIRSFSQFATGFIPGGKVAKLVGVTGKIPKAMVAGLISDITAFDPEDPNLSNAINNLHPALRNPVTEFLATNPGDSEAANRFKRGLEGLGLGVATDALFHGFKLLRGRFGLGRQEKTFAESAAAGAAAPSPGAGEALIPEVMPPTGGAGRREFVGAMPTSGDIPLGEAGAGGVMQRPRLGLPEPSAPVQAQPMPAPTGGAGRFDIVGGQARAGETPLGPTGQGGVMQRPRLALPEPVPAREQMPQSMGMSVDEAQRLINQGESTWERQRVNDIAARLARSQDDPTVLKINRAIRDLEESTVDESGRIISGRPETVGELSAAIERELRASEYLRQSASGGKLLAQDLRQAGIDETLRNSPIIRQAQEEGLRSFEAEIATRMAQDASNRRLLEIVGVPQKKQRLSSIDVSSMYEGIKDIKDAPSLFAIALDEGIPRGIRRSAAEKIGLMRLTEIPFEELDVEDLKSISRSGMFASTIKAVASGKAKKLASQSGEVSQSALFALTRATVGGAIGLTQGETMEERVGNAVMLGGLGAFASPALVKKLIQGFERVAPREAAVLRSFEPGQAGAAKLTPRQQRIASELITLGTPEKAAEFAAANPGTIKIGTTPLKINWENIGDQKSIEEVINKIASIYPKELNEARRGKISKELSDEMARRYGIRTDEFLGLKPGDILNVERTRALIAAVGDSTRHTIELSQRLLAGENVSEQLRKQLAVNADLTLKMAGVRAEQGRVLPVWGEAAPLIERAKRFESDFGAMAIAGKGLEDVPIEKLAQMYLQLGAGPEQANFFLHAMQLGTRSLLEAWINGFLSNPVSHATNTASNTVVLWVGVAERAIAGAFGSTVARGEATEMIHAMTSGWRDSLAVAKKALITGESQFGGAGKIDTRHQRTITAENFNLTGDVGRAVDLLGAAVSSPGRALMAADDFFKSMNYRMELRAQSFRQATNEGLKGGALSKRTDELVASPAFASLVKDQAEGFAAYQTFNQALGDFGNGVLKTLDDHPLARVVLPFVRTPVNIAKYTLERTPLIGLGVKQMRKDIAAGGAARDLALAKQAFGGMSFAVAATLAASGLITGSGPLDPELRTLKRSTGWQPYSVKIGSTYYSYSRLDPIGFMIALAADTVEKAGELTNADIASLATAGTVALKEVFLNKTYLQGVQDLFEAITAREGSKLDNYGRRLLSSIMPAGAKQIGRMIDPTIKEVNTAADAIFGTLPNFGGPARRNIWGEKIILEGALGPDIISPFYKSTEKPDPVTDEMLRLELGVSMPPRWLDGTRPSDSFFKNPNPQWGVRLTPEEYSRYVELSGNATKLDGKGLHDRLGELITTSEYGALSDFDKSTITTQYFNNYRKAASFQLMEEFPELKQAVEQRRQERALSHVPNQQGQ